jgi:hypothetical protein
MLGLLAVLALLVVACQQKTVFVENVVLYVVTQEVE